MKPLVILYATREGQTRRIAEYLAGAFDRLGVPAEVANCAAPDSRANLREYSAAILAASIHVGKHEPEMTSFVRAHRTELAEMPAAFLSVSLAAAGAEDASATEEHRRKSAAAARDLMEKFFEETNWRPAIARIVAGRLAYTQYNWLKRFVMKRIAAAEGGSTDTSKDHEYTNWPAVEEIAREVLAAILKERVAAGVRV